MSQSGSWMTSSGPGAFIETITGNTGGAVGPSGGNINLLGSGNITVTGFPGSNVLFISETSSSALTFDADTGAANPNGLGVINIVGAHNIATVASGNTVAITVAGTTQHAVQIGNSTNSLTSLAIGTTGQVLTGVTGLDPVWASPAASSITLHGDTGSTLTGNSFTIYADNAALGAGSSVLVAGVGSTLVIEVTDINGNTLIGLSTGNLTNSGQLNTALGYSTLTALTSGQKNTIIGAQSLEGISTGSYNTAVGFSAGSAYASGSESSNIVIGSNTIGISGESNILRIGAATGTGNGDLKAAYICGIDGVNVGSVATVVTEASDQLGTAVLTAGTGISITPAANTITIATTAPASFTWSVITVDQTAAVNNGYICNKASTLALALPATSAVGSIIEVTGINNATGWQITQSSGQQIFFGTSSTTSGATGTLTSSATRDAIRIVCIVANTTWQVLSSVGNITVV